MSDPEPLVAACSSSPPSVQVSEPAALNYAFLVHSQKTLTQNLPPRVDNKLLARQKRRRTSPEDHAILEAEYQRNPKPDKTTRVSIVSRVSLGEKEVQIWFQNRRQNDRRKLKPLQPHELLAPRSDISSPLTHMASDDSASGEPESSSGAEQEENGHEENSAGQSLDHVLPQSSFEFEVEHGDKDDSGWQHGLGSQTSVASDAPQQHSNEPVQDPELTQQHENTPLDEKLEQSVKRKRSGSDIHGDKPVIQQLSSTPSGLQDVKSPPSLRISLSFDGEAMVRKEGELTPSPPKGRNSLRIAMSSDGKAVIRAEGEPSPSKNRISMFSTHKPRFAGLRRSTSAVVLGTPRGGSTEKERLFGRSRDPRNWESFFDTDARSALSTPSNSQSTPNSGSRGQRSLTRSLSARNNNILTSTSDHLNTPVPQPTGEKRRKLSRAVSSVARLESGQNNFINKLSAHPSKGLKSTEKMTKEDLELECGDSDKENWIPGTRASLVRRQTAPHLRSQRRVLKEASGKDGKVNRNIPLTGRRSRLSQKTSNNKSVPDMHSDVSAFMAGNGSASQEEDLDCIQGLLSLSQGAWR